eukprot:TRINITY_DN4550_c0_g1_i2.p1 TRINITY_DN4550_c0_g1~~TRINITY_DN4550_c0_g1_i2.p1  ORF type:complete len:265 (-),score=80.63 TRINITY_DN4550_c0_g1_i2:159-953(-)
MTTDAPPLDSAPLADPPPPPLASNVAAESLVQLCFSAKTEGADLEATTPEVSAPFAEHTSAVLSPTAGEAALAAEPLPAAASPSEPSTVALEPAISSGLIRLPNQHKRKGVGLESPGDGAPPDKVFVCECGAGFLMEQSLRIHWGRHCLFKPKTTGPPSKSHRKRQDIPVNVVPVTDVHRLSEIAAAAAQKAIPASSARAFGPPPSKKPKSDEYKPSRSSKSKTVPKYQTFTLPSIPAVNSSAGYDSADDDAPADSASSSSGLA